MTIFTLGIVAGILIYYVGIQIYLKFIKKKHQNHIKYIIPVIAITFAFAIIISNWDVLVNPGPINDKGILEYIFLNKAILYLLIYIGVLLLFAVVWTITMIPFTFNGLKSFSGFGLSAEFNEKVREVVDKSSIINEMAVIKENTLNIVTTKEYYSDTLLNVINQGKIDSGMFIETVLDTIVSIFAKSESNIKLKVHHELIYLNNIEESKNRLKELQKDMSVASLDVVRNKKPSVWENTLALPINPFGIEEELEVYYIVCIHSTDVKFSENEIDFISTVFKVVECFVELNWYKSEAELEQQNHDSTSDTGA